MADTPSCLWCGTPLDAADADARCCSDRCLTLRTEAEDSGYDQLMPLAMNAMATASPEAQDLLRRLCDAEGMTSDSPLDNIHHQDLVAALHPMELSPLTEEALPHTSLVAMRFHSRDGRTQVRIFCRL